MLARLLGSRGLWRSNGAEPAREVGEAGFHGGAGRGPQKFSGLVKGTLICKVGEACLSPQQGDFRIWTVHGSASNGVGLGSWEGQAAEWGEAQRGARDKGAQDVILRHGCELGREWMVRQVVLKAKLQASPDLQRRVPRGLD